MNGERRFLAREYGDGDEVMALVVGLTGEVDQLDHAAAYLAATGRGAVVYQYPSGVLLDGDPTQLPQLVDTLSEDFAQRSSGHRVRLGGVSLGGAIAAGMQNNIHSQDFEPGMFAATGINLGELVKSQPWFRMLIAATPRQDIRSAFRHHSLDELNEVWHSINTPPTTPFTIALGGLDRVVPYRKLRRKVAHWQASNSGINALHLPRLTHGGTIRWFNENCARLLER
jgi:hypothetical protein